MFISRSIAALAICTLSLAGACNASSDVSKKTTEAPKPAAAPAKAEQPAKTEAPAIVFTDLEGKKISLSDMQGKVKVVNFWATWCKPCIKEIPSFNKLHAAYGSKGVAILGVSIDENGADDVKPFLKTQNGKIDYAIALAKIEELGPMGVTDAIPVTLVYDAAGKLVKRFDGYADEAELEAAVKSALGA